MAPSVFYPGLLAETNKNNYSESENMDFDNIKIRRYSIYRVRYLLPLNHANASDTGTYRICDYAYPTVKRQYTPEEAGKSRTEQETGRKQLWREQVKFLGQKMAVGKWSEAAEF